MWMVAGVRSHSAPARNLQTSDSVMGSVADALCASRDNGSAGPKVRRAKPRHLRPREPSPPRNSRLPQGQQLSTLHLQNRTADQTPPKEGERAPIGNCKLLHTADNS